MNVFLSWSGESSKALAAALHRWLRYIFPEVSTWMSDRDVGAGARWSDELDHHIRNAKLGILCLVPDNLTAPWLLFEAGALSNVTNSNHVVPYCLGVRQDKLIGPLAEFQGVAADLTGTLNLLKRINGMVANKRTEEDLKLVLQKFWSELATELDRIKVENPANSDIEILDFDEMVLRFGTIERRYDTAKSDLRISGNDCITAVSAKAPFLERALKRKVTTRILCVDPESPAVEMLPSVDPRFPTADSFRSSMSVVTETLHAFRKQYPSTFEFRYMPILPAIGFFIIDPSLNTGLLKIEVYTAKPFGPVPYRPNVIVPTNCPKWRDYFLQQWENYWNFSREP